MNSIFLAKKTSKKLFGVTKVYFKFARPEALAHGVMVTLLILVQSF